MSARCAWTSGCSPSELAELHAVGDERDRLVDRAARHADRGRADRHAERVERLHRELHALPDRADPRRLGHHHAAQLERADRMRRRRMHRLDGHARCVERDPERGQPAAPRLGSVVAITVA